VNYFQLFGLPETFELDLQRLSERYRELQRTFHPDKFAASSALERRLAMQRAAEINQAFHTLKDPVERATYLLSLRGVDNRNTAAKVDQAFLMEQMELRERLAELRSQPDPSTALEELIADITRRTNTVLQELTRQLEESSERSHTAAQESVAKLMFLRKITREANEIYDELLED